MKKILIIEDNQIIANVYRNKFAVEGYQTEAAHDGETGLKLMRTFLPDVIMLDIMLPQMSGVEVIKVIRGEAEFSKLPVIVLSNTYSTVLIQDAWKAGATKCVSKIDCSPGIMLEIIRGTIGDSGVMMRTRPAAGGARQAGPAMPFGRTGAAGQSDIRDAFVAVLPAALAALRAHLKDLFKAATEEARLKHIHEIYTRIQVINSNAALAGLVQIAHMASAFEVLLNELYQNPKTINDSTLRTTAVAVDFFGFLFEHGIQPDKQEIPPASVLVVDDEIIACCAIAYALGKANLRPVTIEDPNSALKMLSEKQFDIVLLDVDMPGMTGYQLCAKMRAMPQNKNTPVIFVTRLNSFDSRATSNVVGGNDFIAKPFLPIELAVKSLIHILRAKLQPAKNCVLGQIPGQNPVRNIRSCLP
ncbi:MAG: response regulator [Verrucomicrobiota bacterium]